jgi:hypothetical protein
VELKTSHLGRFFCLRPVEPPPRAVEPPLAGLAASLTGRLTRRLIKVDQHRLNRPGGAVEPPLTAPGDLYPSLTGRLQIRGQRGQRPAELPLRTSSTGLDQRV